MSLIFMLQRTFVNVQNCYVSVTVKENNVMKLYVVGSSKILEEMCVLALV